MRDKPFYELLSRIDDDSLLANFFNKVLGNLDMARIISAPRTFRHKDDENSRYCIDLFMIHACGKCIFINSYTS